jgi:hypothetical protein
MRKKVLRKSIVFFDLMKIFAEENAPNHAIFSKDSF